MSTQFIQKSATSGRAASRYTGEDCGIGYDSADGVFYINPEGTRLKVRLAADGEVVAATNVITALENGKTFYLASATEFVSTLPAPFIGGRYEFVVSAAPSGASYTVLTNASAEVLFGQVVSCAGATGDSESTGGATTYTFVDGQAVKGDRAVFSSDGVSWYVSGVAAVVAGATITG